MARASAPPARTRIFINYRRTDSDVVVGRLAADLRREFTLPDQIFEDINSIDPGAPFAYVLQRGLDTCAAVLVVIGPDWLSAKDPRGRARLQLPEDWVRREVAASLKRGDDVRVFPVLVDDAEMPGADDLPEDLRSLADRQAIPLVTRHWNNDFARLVGLLRRVPGLGQPSANPELPPSPGATGQPAREAVPPRRPQPQAFTSAANNDDPPGARVPWKGIAAIGGVVLAGAVALNIGGKPEPAPALALPAAVEAPAPAKAQPAPKPEAPVPAKAPAAAPATGTAANATPAPAPAKAQTTPQPGETFRDCTQCPEMVVMRAGSFTMGSPPSEIGRDDDEGPQRKVSLSRAFAVGKFEVTFGEWDACMAEGGCAHKPNDNGWGRGRQPVIAVSWQDAQAYVTWLSKKTGKPYRLLTEAEWEYAARAETSTRYPWGDAPGSNLANFEDSGGRWSFKQTGPVGSFAANGFGLHDMIGNVWEWTQDCYNKNYKGAPVDGRAWESGNCGVRVVRGGSWFSSADFARVANRIWGEPADRDSFLGFRLARTL